MIGDWYVIAYIEAMDMGAALDIAIYNAVTAQATPPAIVRPFFDPDAEAGLAEQKAAEAIERNRIEFDRWSEGGQASLRALAQVFREHEVGREQLDLLLQGAVGIEEDAEALAIQLARQEKRGKASLKELRKIAPKLADVYTAALASALELSAKELDARLEAALFFRALRAEHTPDNSTGKVMSSAEDVDRVFRELLAS